MISEYLLGNGPPVWSDDEPSFLLVGGSNMVDYAALSENPQSTVLAVLTETTNLFLCPSFCCGFTWILQQVCAFIFLCVQHSVFSPSSPWKLISSLVFDGFALLSFFQSLLTPNCVGKKLLLSCPVLQVTLDYTHHYPPLSVSLPGSQIYHSAVCIFVQFLMLRLMGRTVTTVLSSFAFQMVRCLSVFPSVVTRLSFTVVQASYPLFNVYNQGQSFFIY